MPAPRQVNIEVRVHATQMDENGICVPLPANICITPRIGGLMVEVAWAGSANTAVGSGDAIAPGEEAANDARPLVQAQEWLASRIREWSRRP